MMGRSDRHYRVMALISVKMRIKQCWFHKSNCVKGPIHLDRMTIIEHQLGHVHDSKIMVNGRFMSLKHAYFTVIDSY